MQRGVHDPEEEDEEARGKRRGGVRGRERNIIAVA